MPAHRERKTNKERPTAARPLAARCARVPAARPGCEAASLVHVRGLPEGMRQDGEDNRARPRLEGPTALQERDGQPFVLRC